MFGIIFFMKKKVVLTYGTFDLFHYGHDNIVMKAKKEMKKNYIISVFMAKTTSVEYKENNSYLLLS